MVRMTIGEMKQVSCSFISFCRCIHCSNPRFHLW